MCKQISKDLLYECDGTCSASGSVWGSITYTGDSNIFMAAKHAGLVPGKFMKINKGPQQSFIGTSKNGITTSNYGYFASSYTLVKEGDNQHQVFHEIQSFRAVMNAELDRFKQALAASISENKYLCCMCNNLPRTHLCMPCNHVNYCQECIKIILEKGNCAVCNQVITGFMRVYL